MIINRALLFLTVATQISTAGLIYESAPLSSLLWLQGASLSREQFIGARFVLPQSAHITAVGAAVGFYMTESQEFFAALVRLPDVTALPSSNPGMPFQPMPLWTQVFTVVSQSEDVRLPTSLSLPSGAYALVFGSGLFGAAENEGYVPTPTGVPEADIISWYDSTGGAPPQFKNATWHDLMGHANRFVVEGIYVPEPGSLHLISAVFCVLPILVRSRRRVQQQTRGSDRHHSLKG